MSSTVQAREVVALLSDGQTRTGLIDLGSGIFVYADHKIARAVTVTPHDNTVTAHGWITCRLPADRTVVVAHCSEFSC